MPVINKKAAEPKKRRIEDDDDDDVIPESPDIQIINKVQNDLQSLIIRIPLWPGLEFDTYLGQVGLRARSE